MFSTTFDVELLRRFRVACATNEEKLNAVLARAMEEYCREMTQEPRT